MDAGSYTRKTSKFPVRPQKALYEFDAPTHRVFPIDMSFGGDSWFDKQIGAPVSPLKALHSTSENILGDSILEIKNNSLIKNNFFSDSPNSNAKENFIPGKSLAFKSPSKKKTQRFYPTIDQDEFKVRKHAPIKILEPVRNNKFAIEHLHNAVHEPVKRKQTRALYEFRAPTFRNFGMDTTVGSGDSWFERQPNTSLFQRQDEPTMNFTVFKEIPLDIINGAIKEITNNPQLKTKVAVEPTRITDEKLATEMDQKFNKEAISDASTKDICYSTIATTDPTVVAKTSLSKSHESSKTTSGTDTKSEITVEKLPAKAAFAQNESNNVKTDPPPKSLDVKLETEVTVEPMRITEKLATEIDPKFNKEVIPDASTKDICYSAITTTDLTVVAKTSSSKPHTSSKATNSTDTKSEITVEKLSAKASAQNGSNKSKMRPPPKSPGVKKRKPDRKHSFGPTKPKPFRFHSTARPIAPESRKRSPYIPLTTRVQKFLKETPRKHRSKVVNPVENKTYSQASRPTQPRSPLLLTKLRSKKPLTHQSQPRSNKTQPIPGQSTHQKLNLPHSSRGQEIFGHQTKEKLKRVQEKEPNTRRFKAQPLLDDSPAELRAHDPPLTEPKPFKFRTVQRGEQHQKNTREKSGVQRRNEKQNARFQTRSASKVVPTLTKRSKRPLTQAIGFKFRTDARLEERRKFDAKRKLREKKPRVK